MNNEQMLLLVKMIESNIKLSNSYKNIYDKINKMENIINTKIKSNNSDMHFIKIIIETSNESYYKISKNCLASYN